MDYGIGLCVDDVVYSAEEVIVDLFLAEVDSSRRIESGECCEAKVGVSDVDEFHL